jgi:hypothetical protein
MRMGFPDTRPAGGGREGGDRLEVITKLLGTEEFVFAS